MKFEIVVKSGLKEITRIEGQRTLKDSDITLEEGLEVLRMEALLEKLTGFRFHINIIQ
jgi:hypothetical protein